MKQGEVLLQVLNTDIPEAVEWNTPSLLWSAIWNKE